MRRLFLTSVLLSIGFTLYASNPGGAQDPTLPSSLQRFEPYQAIHPNKLEADFDGDGNVDVAYSIRSRTTGEIGIGIVHGGHNETAVIVGAGSKRINESPKWEKNLDWVKSISLIPRSEDPMGAPSGIPGMAICLDNGHGCKLGNGPFTVIICSNGDYYLESWSY